MWKRYRYNLNVVIMCIVLAFECQSIPFRSHFQRPGAKQKAYYLQQDPNSLRRYASDIGENRHGDAPNDRHFSYGQKRTVDDYSEDATSHNSRGKTGKKRGIDVGIQVHYATTQKSAEMSNLEKLEDVLEKVIESKLEEVNATACPSCEEEEEFIAPMKRTVKPAYKCDEWNSKHRICILERNIGDTVTFYLSTGHHARVPNVTWKQEFHLRNSANKKEFVIQPDNPPENVIVGRRGHELRVSPITETDVEYNLYSAMVASQAPSARSKVYFMIRIVPIDLGFVYVGETIELDLGKFVSLPARSMSFRWYMEKEGETGTLPSNMRVSGSGRSIKISELRQEQEGVLACSVYTDLDVLATKKRFLVRDLSKNKDVLQSSPNHTLIFKEESPRDKRDPRSRLLLPISSAKLSRRARYSGLSDDVEKAMWDLTTTHLPRTRSLDYNAEMNNVQSRDEAEQPSAEDNSFPEISESEDGELQRPKQIDIDIDRGPMQGDQAVEVQDANEDSLFPTQPRGGPMDTQDADVDGSPGIKHNNRYQQENFQESKNSKLNQGYPQELPSQNIQEDPNPQIARGYQQELPSENLQEGGRNPELVRAYQQELPPQNFQEGVNAQIDKGYQPYRQELPPSQEIQEFKGSELGNPPVPASNYQGENVDYRRPYRTRGKFKQGKSSKKDDFSEIVLNIGKVNRPRQIAEDWISKLISSCIGDYDCSETAICVRINLKQRGFCRCLPGSRGVGIFCREENQMSDSFDEELVNPDYPQ